MHPVKVVFHVGLLRCGSTIAPANARRGKRRFDQRDAWRIANKPHDGERRTGPIWLGEHAESLHRDGICGFLLLSMNKADEIRTRLAETGYRFDPSWDVFLADPHAHLTATPTTIVMDEVLLPWSPCLRFSSGLESRSRRDRVHRLVRP